MVVCIYIPPILRTFDSNEATTPGGVRGKVLQCLEEPFKFDHSFVPLLFYTRLLLVAFHSRSQFSTYTIETYAYVIQAISHTLGVFTFSGYDCVCSPYLFMLWYT